MKRLSLALLAFACHQTAFTQDKPPAPDAVEFFEKKVRPVLAKHCYECHAATAKKVKGGLLVDSRAGLLRGGDNGPALVPGEPDKSRLIEAIRYVNVDLRMPRNGKLSEAEITALTAWVKMGAPWPDEKPIKKSTYAAFDLAKRKAEHWSWQPIRVSAIPEVKNEAWARGDIDRFLLAKLEATGLRPAADADPLTLIRRLYFDLIGLPPGRAELEEFVRAWDAAGAKREAMIEAAVDRLLASPRFGERWGRHWLDLMRYAESRGHEFDYTIPNAYQYRDYVIRAFNSDVPYNQLVMEHIAGDLFSPRPTGGEGAGVPGELPPEPRMHKDGFNESILGTGFWFLGEECHSPVDIRQDEADRFDNRIDVMSKAFLGLTVACARCHDHKFDAISTEDYYALFGMLESSNYRLARFDTIAHNRKVAEELWEFRKKSGPALARAFSKAAGPTLAKLDDYLATAAGIEGHAEGLDPERIKLWKARLQQAARDKQAPLHFLAVASAERKRSVAEIQADFVRGEMRKIDWFPPPAKVIVDYSGQTPVRPLLADDVAFGPGPLQPGAILLGSTPARPIARIVENAAAEFDRAFDGMKLAAGAQNESGALGGALRSGRTLRTPEFALEHGRAYALVKGSGMIYAAVGQHVMIAGPLHGDLVQRFHTAGKFQWVAINLMPYKGQRLHLEFTPNAGTEFALQCVVDAPQPPPLIDMDRAVRLSYFNQAKTLPDAVKATATMLRTALENLGTAPTNPPIPSWVAANWAVQNGELFFAADSAEGKELAATAGPILDAEKKIVAGIKLESRLAPAMQDGAGCEGAVFIRGNPKTPGKVVPRRFLEALAGRAPLKIAAGSGRLELARQMTDPKMNPFITRVYVNRVWHHLFGRGIVGSVDNFGVLGEAPTHPELLDYLAARFAERAGYNWSTKKLIRALVLSRAYQMASTPDRLADEADPGDLLLHRMRMRRLEGEAIRDAMLAVSGRLNPAMYGPAVPIYLTPFQEGRGRPGSGPLDGDGRRSVYLAVRRNFLSPFLLAFDSPAPFSCVGRRTMSNVPAQALILMNDPFVHGQASVWARRILAQQASDPERVRGMYLDAFARPPSESELRACVAYLGSAPDERRWAGLAHVLMNAKEFYFVN